MKEKQLIYIAICKDRHQDDEIELFLKKSKAITYCKKFMKDRPLKNWTEYEYKFDIPENFFHDAVDGDYEVYIVERIIKC
jgi:hypothetical protein